MRKYRVIPCLITKGNTNAILEDDGCTVILYGYEVWKNYIRIQSEEIKYVTQESKRMQKIGYKWK